MTVTEKYDVSYSEVVVAVSLLCLLVLSLLVGLVGVGAIKMQCKALDAQFVVTPFGSPAIELTYRLQNGKTEAGNVVWMGQREPGPDRWWQTADVPTKYKLRGCEQPYWKSLRDVEDVLMGRTSEAGALPDKVVRLLLGVRKLQTGE